MEVKNHLLALLKHPVFRIGRYFLRRVMAVLLTIVIGVFIAVVIANSKGMIDSIIQKAVNDEIRQISRNPEFSGDLDQERSRLIEQEGLNLPFFQKHVLYTSKALFMGWGNYGGTRSYLRSDTSIYNITSGRTSILSQLPNTLLLSGFAYLLLALIGIPLALFLSQREGLWLDKLIGVLTPISSVPSWVIGVILVIIFAVEFKLFPVGKMFDLLPPQTTWEKFLNVGYHMVLPVTAIFLSMFFNLVYNWRTYLLINSDEDYVTLGKAQGLKRQRLERLYILRPALPYMLTSIVLTLVGFWQTITALEYFFQWPGIGKLFVDALPNFFGESMYYGEMGIILGIIVLFAYFLGITLLLLDFCYVLVDPRLRLDPQEKVQGSSVRIGESKMGRFLKSIRWKLSGQSGDPSIVQSKSLKTTRSTVDFRTLFADFWEGLRETSAVIKGIWIEIRREPMAIIGLALISLLVILSIVVLIYIPYNPIGRDWARSNLTGNPTVAKLGLPSWINWFRKNDLPSTILLDSSKGQAVKRFIIDPSGTRRVQIDFVFDYPYKEFPSEITMYATSQYREKKPLVTLSWITPDLRVYHPKNASVSTQLTYLFSENVPFRKELSKNRNWQEWFVTEGSYPTPAYYILFADPEEDEPRAVDGTYGLRIEGYLFEEDSDIDVQLVIFGQVEGWAGTDNLRRDLSIPLLWGLPFALMIGVLGAVTTTLISLVIAAASAWFGGWFDSLMQRAIEANLILPVMAIGVLLYSYYGFNLWLILGLIIFLNIFGGPTKAFRAAFLQVKESAYVEAAKSYGARDLRIINRYLIPRILPVIIPQIVILIPNFFFLEATLAIFNISDNRYPTWGRIIYDGLRYGAAYGSRFWVLEPITLMLLTGLSFVLLGFALNRVFNPQLKHV